MSSSMIHSTTRPLRPDPSTHNSEANQEALDSIFAKGPSLNGYDNAAVQEKGRQLLLGKEVTGDQDTDWKAALNHWGYRSTTTLDYAANGAPDYADVETGGGGLPASAWVPNPVSPGEGMNPADQAAAPEGYGTIPNPQWGNGPGVVNMAPSHSSTRIKEGVTIGGSNGIQDGAGTRSWPNGDAG